MSFNIAYRVGSAMEWGHTLFGMQSEPKMTRFLAEQLAMSHWFSIAKAQQVLSYNPKVSTSDGIDRLVAWLKNHKNHASKK